MRLRFPVLLLLALHLLLFVLVLLARYVLSATIDTGQGYGVFGGRGMHDTHAYGRIPFREVIAKSSNVGMATVVLEKIVAKIAEELR